MVGVVTGTAVYLPMLPAAGGVRVRREGATVGSGASAGVGGEVRMDGANERREAARVDATREAMEASTA